MDPTEQAFLIDHHPTPKSTVKVLDAQYLFHIVFFFLIV